MTVPLIKLTMPAVISVVAGWDGAEIWLDCENGDANVALPPASTLPAGWRCRFRKSDDFAFVMAFRVQGTDRLNRFYGATHPYGIICPMPQDVVELTCDGVGDWSLAELTHHTNVPRSQRTIAVPAFQCTPRSHREIVYGNVTLAGGNIQVSLDPTANWCPPAPAGTNANGGDYLSCVVWFMKVDAGTGPMVICPAPGEFINPSNDPLVNPGYNRGYFYLLKQWDAMMLYITAGGGLFALNYTRASMMPVP